MPCVHGLNGRNLIVCIDGTSNKFGDKNTNVVKLYEVVMKESQDNQRTWYNSGIGTFARPSLKALGYYRKKLYHPFDMAFAWDFEKIIFGAYQWLSDNYTEGDRIFLFGFSRGAYQVRVLSAMIHKVGLIHKGNNMQIPFAFELYTDRKSYEALPALEGSTRAQRFKDSFCHKDVQVHFIGAWDTVSSVGVQRGKFPGTVDGTANVCYFRHALALDERRVKFLPEYACGGMGRTMQIEEDVAENGKSKDNILSQIIKKFSGARPQTLEVWFPGAHSDVGGENVMSEGMDRHGPSLRWMILEGESVGLRTVPVKCKEPLAQQIMIEKSLTWYWAIFEIFPIKRLRYTPEGHGLETTFKPHLASHRNIHLGQKIHNSFVLVNDEYLPKARPVDGTEAFWQDLRHIVNRHEFSPWLELDLFDYIAQALERFIMDNSDLAHQALYVIAILGERLQAVYDKAIETLISQTHSDVQSRILRLIMKIIEDGSPTVPLKLSDRSEIEPVLSNLQHSTNQEYKMTADKFVKKFSPCMHTFRGHTAAVRSVTFSPTSSFIASASNDSAVRLWDLNEPDKSYVFLGHSSWVNAVAFLPDGLHMVSGSADCTLRIWSIVPRQEQVGILTGHTNFVTSVAVSPNRNIEQLASGSSDGTIRIWDLTKMGPDGASLRQHSDQVTSVAFSHDGCRLVSGSNDKSFVVWDITSRMVITVLRGHTSVVKSVSFSGNGNKIVSGSLDSTIGFAALEANAKPRQILFGSSVCAISVWSDAELEWVASGMSDGTVQVWDEKTKKSAAPLEAHEGSVSSVAFSPNGKLIASCSADNTIRVWDVTGVRQWFPSTLDG